MPKVEFLPTKKTAVVERGSALLDAARKAGVEIEAPCGGKGACGDCLVRILKGQVDSDSLGHLSPTAVADGYVLACRTAVTDADIQVEVPEALGRKGGKFADDETENLIRKELLPKEWDFDPLAVKWLLNVPAPLLEEGLSDLDRITRAVQQDWGAKEVVYTLSAMRSAAEVLRVNNGQITVTLIREQNRLRIIGVESGNSTTRHFGIAVDIGTTTVAVQLINLTMGRIMATRSDYNGQIPCGLDVISRINYAKKPVQREELRTRILNTVNRLIQLAAESHQVQPREIANAVVSGNTVMTHLLLGLNPEFIRLAPYTPTIMESPFLTAGEVGLEINPDSWIYLSPSVGSYVGGDITAGILCTDLALDSAEINLFIDIGTNGELVVGNNEFLMACACSAGPAFEGQGIECGMRAAWGAIEKVRVDPLTAEAWISTIGNTAPQGICGSGMINLLADLLLTGWLDPGGKFDRSRPSPHVEKDGKRARYVIVPAGKSADGKPLYITEADVENILRAKAAIYSACAMMLEQVGLSFDDLSHVYVAGGFGRFLDLDKAKIIGLLPDLPREKYHYIGNSSLMGSYMAVVSQDYRERQLKLSRRMTYLELSTNPTYMDQFTGALFLPHTDMSRFPSVTKALREAKKKPASANAR